jgi:HEPN domain-containing protein
VQLIRADLLNYYTGKNLFGDGVDSKFPSTKEDIENAGKCIGVGQDTAAVFHIMRAMEAAVAELSRKLSITNTEREWGKLLSDIHKKIEQMPRGSERNAWSECHANLYHVKQAWRNQTMHPKATYTQEQAKEIFQTTRVFMSQLATLI